MWKVLTGLFLATAVITASVILFPMRHRLFRPDVARAGGTRLVLKVTGDADDVAAALRNRFDPKEAEGMVIAASPGRVTIDVPNGRRHDENAEIVRRLAGRPGRFRVGFLIHPQDDAAAVTAGKAWLKVAANGKALEEAHTKGTPFPPFEGAFKLKDPSAAPAGYDWAAIDWSRAAVTHGLFGSPVATARDHFPLTHELPATGRYGTAITLVRRVADGEGLTNADVGRARVDAGNSRVMFSTRLIFRIEADGFRRMNDLITRATAVGVVTPRYLGLVLDDEVLMYFDVHRSLSTTTFQPVMDAPFDGEDRLALLNAPLPAGATVALDGEEVLSPR